MSGYVLSAGADLDLDDIWEYIAADSVDAADSWIGKLFDGLEIVPVTRSSRDIPTFLHPRVSSV
jgi:plasmid stabilization system protein ParE